MNDETTGSKSKNAPVQGKGRRWARLRRVLVRRLLPAALLLASLGLFFSGAAWWTLRSAVRVPEVGIPDLSGLDAEVAAARLKRLGLPSEVAARRFDARQPEGDVIDHTPAAGARTKPGRVVRLVVSLGPERVAVPDLAGLTLRTAKLSLNAFKLRVRLTSEIYDARVPEGRVVAQNPAAGTVGYPGDSVSLLVSRGRRRPDYVMPSLIGRQAAAARRSLESAGIRRIRTRGAVESPLARVLRQVPQPGYRVSADERVILDLGLVAVGEEGTSR